MDISLIPVNQNIALSAVRRDVSAEVEIWINGTRHPGMGLIFKTRNIYELGATLGSTVDRLKYFGSYNRSDYKPSLSIEYSNIVNSIVVSNVPTGAMIKGTSVTLGVTTVGDGAVSWTSGNSNVAYVSNQTLYATGCGATTITANFGLASLWNQAFDGIVTNASIGENNIIIYDINDSTEQWVGQAIPYLNTIKLNGYYLDTYAVDKQQKTIMHEMGHILGLDHNPCDSEDLSTINDNYHCRNIMYPVSAGIVPLSRDDKYSLDSAYYDE